MVTTLTFLDAPIYGRGTSDEKKEITNPILEKMKNLTRTETAREQQIQIMLISELEEPEHNSHISMGWII